MRMIDFNTIKNMHISPQTCLEWVKDAFIHKSEAQLPSKVGITQPDNIFFNTMPCLIPNEKVFGVKVVSRFPAREPSIQAEISLYDSTNGKLLAIMDGSWITMMRTGAVAALAIDTLKKADTKSFSIIGLGNTARATLLCLQSLYPNNKLTINVLAYKGQEELFIKRFEAFSNLSFVVYDELETMFSISDVIISCLTAANGILASDATYKEGVLIVPVHTRGFQNCDLFFDKVFADDTEHVESFKYFKQFKAYDELSNVLLKNKSGRTSDKERILSYNIGIALHDIYFANKIYQLCKSKALFSNTDKYWV